LNSKSANFVEFTGLHPPPAGIGLSTFNFQPATGSLLLIFTFAEPFEHGEPGFFGVGDGERLELVRRAESGKDFAHRLFASRTFRQLRRAQRPAQGELAAAHLALALAQLVFVKRHEMIQFFVESGGRIFRNTAVVVKILSSRFNVKLILVPAGCSKVPLASRFNKISPLRIPAS